LNLNLSSYRPFVLCQHSFEVNLPLPWHKAQRRALSGRYRLQAKKHKTKLVRKKAVEF